MRNYYDAYFIHIYYELITILFTYCTHTHTHTHTRPHTRIWNQFKQFRITYKGDSYHNFKIIKEIHQNLTIKNSMDEIFI